MRLCHVAIEGFRGFRSELQLPIDSSLTVLVGRNDAGKSSVLEALDAFFSNGKLVRDDWSVGHEGDVSITASFDELPEEILLDSTRSTSLATEHLLDEAGRLTIKRVWSSPGSSAKSFLVCRHPETDEPPITMKIAALRAAAIKAGIPRNEVDGRVSSTLRTALLNKLIHDGAPFADTQIPLSVDDGKLIADQIHRTLPRFHMFSSDRSASSTDRLAQDPTRLIIDSVLDRHTEQLEDLRARVSTEIASMLSTVLQKLAEIDPALAQDLTPEISEPSWARAFATTQFKDENSVPLERRGTGVRRLVLLSFFRAEAEELQDDTAPIASIMAIEEPETALHPDLQLQVLQSLKEIAARAGRQIIFTTHSSNLLQLVDVGSVRYLESIGGARSVVVGTETDRADLIGRINKSLGMLTDHAVRCFLLVEGARDIESLLLLSSNLHSRGFDGIADLRNAQESGRLRILPIGGCGAIALWETNLEPLQRFELQLLDSDRVEAGGPLKTQVADAVAKSTSERVVHALELRELENYLSTESIKHAFSHLPGFDSHFDQLIDGRPLGYLDIPAICAEAAWLVHQTTLSDGDRVEYATLEQQKRDDREGKAKKRLVGAFSHESVLASEQGAPADLIEVLRLLSSKL